MHGNLWEWVAEVGDRPDSPDGGTEEVVGFDAHGSRVVRGGGLTHEASSCRSAARTHGITSVTLGNVGFRVARSAE